MLVVSILLALAAVLFGAVRAREVPALLDLRLLELFVVLILAAECARLSRGLDFVVRLVLSRVRSERTLALAAVFLSGGLAALVTNDVALLLVVPFTLAFERAAPDFDPAKVVILEIAAANLVGCLSPTGNPQNLFLFRAGAFTGGRFLAAQLPWVAGMAAVLVALIPLVVRRRSIVRPPPRRIRVHRWLASMALLLLSVQLLSLFGLLPRMAPMAAAVPAGLLLGRRLLRVDFSLVAVFSALFVGIEGIRRSALAAALDPVRLLGATPTGFVLSGALVSQVVSNVPAAMLLAPAADAAGGGPLFVALLYGVNAGGCGTPIASLANLIGADLYLRGRTLRRRFWGPFLAVSGLLLAAAILLSLLLTGC
jgi:Na+/H+ antiporter NhaD/arsenite permease-like protein